MLIITYTKNFMWIWIHWPVTVLNDFCRWTEIPSCYGTNGAEEVVCLIKKPWSKNKPNLALKVTIQISLAKKPSSIGLQKWNLSIKVSTTTPSRKSTPILVLKTISIYPWKNRAQVVESFSGEFEHLSYPPHNYCLSD